MQNPRIRMDGDFHLPRLHNPRSYDNDDSKMVGSSSTSSSVRKLEERTDALGRKVWDKEFYSKKAEEKALLYGEDELDDENITNLLSKNKKEKPYPTLNERKYLQERDYDVNLEKELGQFKVITQHTPKMQQGGYWCDVCECLIKDSQAFLDHINGRRHNRMLGMTMKVESVGLDKVKNRIKLLKKQKAMEEAAKNTKNEDLADEIYAQEISNRIKSAKLNDEERKQRRREKKKKHKKEKYINDDDVEMRRRRSRSRSLSQEGKAKKNEKQRENDIGMPTADFLGDFKSTESGFGEREKQKEKTKVQKVEQAGTLGEEINEEDDEEARMLAALGLPTKFSGL